jgi:hypothetical protein
LSSFTDSTQPSSARKLHVDDLRVGALHAALLGEAAQVCAYSDASNWKA